MPQRLLLTNDDGSTVIDLLLGPLKVMNWGWDTQPTSLSQRITSLPFGVQAASLGYPQVIETLSLATFGCQAEIRAAVRELEEFLENAKAYMDDPVYAVPHWLEWSSEGEAVVDPVTDAVTGKRALVVGGAWQWYSRPPTAWPMIDGPVLMLKLALTRHPLWEETSYTGKSAPGSSVNTVGGTVAFTNVVGRVPARIWVTQFYAALGLYNEVTIDKIWCGFRQENWGLGAFNPLWECETDAGAADGNGTLENDTADAADAAIIRPASGGYVAQTTFTDTVLERRVIMSVETVIGSPTAPSGTDAAHFAGRYLVLCRCNIDDDTKQAAIQMRSGYENGIMAAHDLITITHELPMYVELGEIQIPPPGVWSVGALTTEDKVCQAFTIELWAQNTDATSLDMDCLVLVPSDYFLKLENAAIYLDAAPATETYAVVVRRPDERIFAYNGDFQDNDTVIGSAIVSPNSYYLPTGNSTFVLAAQRTTEQDIDDDLNPLWEYYPRWMSYRE